MHLNPFGTVPKTDAKHAQMKRRAGTVRPAKCVLWTRLFGPMVLAKHAPMTNQTTKTDNATHAQMANLLGTEINV